MKVSKTRFVLAVPNLPISVAYYRDTLGMKVEFEVPGWAFMSRGSFAVMLGECPDAPTANDIGDHSYFAYVTVEAIDNVFDELSAHGVDLIKKLVSEPWGMREFGIRTIDGHRIMFGQELDQPR